MATYLVTLEERLRYTIEVEADDEDAAHEEAEEMFVDTANPFVDFNGECCDRRAVIITEKTSAV